MTTLNNLKSEFEGRFREKWTSLSVQYHFKALISHLFSIPFGEVLFHLNKEVSINEYHSFQVFMVRLENNEPLQHIIGETEFMGLLIRCSPAALIPRPETEELVELILHTFKGSSEKIKVLDVCTGTGCIAIALKKYLTESQIYATDYFDETLALARSNAELNAVSIDFQNVNALSVSEMRTFQNGEFDIWVSNPPYIPEIDKGLMNENVLLFEPHEALFVSNDDPLIFYRKICENAQLSLKKNGFLFFEINEYFGKEMIALLTENNFKNVCLYKDMQGKNRMIIGQK